MAEKKTAAETAAETLHENSAPSCEGGEGSTKSSRGDRRNAAGRISPKPSPRGEGGSAGAEPDEVFPPAGARKTVTLRLPRARAGEEDVVFIGVNGKAWRIRRGVTVEVPRSVAEVLRNSMSAEERAELYKAALS